MSLEMSYSICLLASSVAHFQTLHQLQAKAFDVPPESTSQMLSMRV